MRREPFIEQIHNWYKNITQNILNLSGAPTEIETASKTAQNLLYRTIISQMLDVKCKMQDARCWMLDTGSWMLDDDILLRDCEGILSKINQELATWNLREMPYEILSDIYESYLTRKISFNSSGSLQFLPEGKLKKGKGIYYTPRYIVKFIVDLTLGRYLWGTEKNSGNPSVKGLEDIQNLRILDPACGSGSFLAYAFDILADFYAFYMKDNPVNYIPIILEKHLYGVDTDRDALDITSTILMLKFLKRIGNESKINSKLNIKYGNFLTSDFTDQVFTIILGNPPYGVKINEHEKALIKSCNDSSCLFIEKSIKILEDKGILGFIVPKSLSYVSSWKPIREFLLRECKITDIGEAKKAFKGVRLEEIVLIAQKNTHPIKGTEVHILNPVNSSASHIIDDSALNSGRFSIWLSNQRIKDICHRIWEKSVPLAELAEIWSGLSIQNQMISSDVWNDEDTSFCLRGRDIKRYHVKSGLKHIRLSDIKNKKRLNLDRFFQPKIIVQDIVAYILNPVPHIKLMAAIDDSKSWINVNTVTNITGFEYDLEYLCGLLNSRFISWYTHNFIYNRAIRTMHFRSGYADHIPIPRVDLDDSQSRKIYKQMVLYVKQIISLYQIIPLKPKITDLEEKIENLVHRIYGITPEDLKFMRENAGFY
jgi:type I restriction-modification system DNA methylase subunit